MDAKKKGILIMAVALLLGLSASMLAVKILASKQMRQTKAEPAKKIEVNQLMVAAKDLALGTVISAEDIQLSTWPKKLIPRTAFSKSEDLIGKVVQAQIFAGEPVTEQRVAAQGSSKGLGVLIPPGMRAMTVEVDEELGASGFFRAGTKIDIIATGRPKGDEKFTKIVLQDIQILSMSGEEGSSRKTPKTIVTMAIKPEDAEKLALALNEGKIHMIVRNALDEKKVATAGVSATELLKVRPLDVTEGNKGRREIEIKVVELILGDERKEEKFQR